MRAIILDIEALRTAGAKVGVFGDNNLTTHLGVDISLPATMELVAAVLTRLPVEAPAVFRMVDVSTEKRRPNGEWPVALAGQ